MADVLQFRRGTQAENDAFTGEEGELSIDKTNWKLRLHDNSTAGGFALARDVHVHAASDVTSGTFADARIAETNVTQHEGALSLSASQISEISNLTAAEGAQLENIDSVTITNAQWGHVGSMDQGVSTSDSPSFSELSVNGQIKEDPEHATDSATDAFVSATNTTPPADGVKIVRDFQSSNGTTTPTLDGKTITDRDGNALWASAISGPHTLQRDQTADTYLLLYPIGTDANVNNAPVSRDANGRAKFADPSAAQDAATKSYTDAQIADGDPTLDTVIDATNGGANDLSEITFTGIKSDADRITIILNNISLSGTDDLLVQIGSGGIVTSGYISTGVSINNAGGTSGSTSTSGYFIEDGAGGNSITGHVVLTRLTGNDWYMTAYGKKNASSVFLSGGGLSLAGALDRVRLTVTGTDTFDSGRVNILVE